MHQTHKDCLLNVSGKEMAYIVSEYFTEMFFINIYVTCYIC